MGDQVRQLIDEAIELTGAPGPTMLDDDAPVLAATSPESMYLVGLVGGKDVGKSSLVNAIVGEAITPATSFGPGTQTVIAYAHEAAVPELRALLEREVPGRYSIITHTLDRLRRQVLLDLPDIDSKYDDHLLLTRRMLRHMLYPLWVQSIEKYADLRPQELLAAVAEGNDPTNFLFVLNKADQLTRSTETGAAQEIREDYGRRLAKAVGLPESPKVFLISASHPEQFDLPAMREQLAREKTPVVVQSSRELARRRQDKSLLGWLSCQHLDRRLAQLRRIEDDAEELAAQRIAQPLLERAIPAMLDDPGQRMAILAPAARSRLARWPVVNAIDALLWPVLALVQRNLSASPAGSADPDAYLEGAGRVSSLVQASFAQLHQLHPDLGDFYAGRKLWDSIYADQAAADLRQRYAATAERQRAAALRLAGGKFNWVMAPLRWVLTIGAILWFPIVQPVLAVMLQRSAWTFSRELLLTIVNVLSVSHLLQCVTFLLLWFVVLWVWLRWQTQRRVSQMINRWKRIDAQDDLSFTSQTLEWIDGLIAPVRRRRERLDSLVERSQKLIDGLSVASAAS